MLETVTDSDAAKARFAERHRFIPIRKRELLDAVLAHPKITAGDVPRLTALARHLALIFHVEFFSKRDGLKDAYVRFNPEQPGKAPIPPDAEARSAFLDDLHSVLMAANFHEMAGDEILSGTDSAGRVGAQVKVPTDVFDFVRFYARGGHTRPITVKKFFGTRRRQVEAPVFHDVVFIAALRSDVPEKALKGTRLRAGAVYLKQFRDIPRADLQTLYPNARVVMGLQDQLILGVPAVVGGIPILLNIVPTLTVLFIVIGAYLGISGAVEDDAMKKALAALSGLGALVGFLMRQWVKYERQKLKYQKQVSENAYFNMVNNNSGFFDTLIGASEDSEVKEACLAYAFLHIADRPLSRADLDGQIEEWLTQAFGVDVDFEIDDAIAKLERLRLVTETDGLLTAVPLDTALAQCEQSWVSLALDSIP
jgi:hypothetical protein